MQDLLIPLLLAPKITLTCFMRKTFLGLIFVLCFVSSDAQTFQLGIGGIGGYKSTYGSSGWFVVGKFFNRVSIDVGLNGEKIGGPGISSQLKYYFLKKKINPYLGIGYGYFSDSEFYTGDLEPDRSYYYTSYRNILNCSIGSEFILIPKEFSEGMQFSILPEIGYRFFLANQSVNYISGVINESEFSELNKKIKNGLSFSVSISFYFISKKNNTVR